MLFTEPLSVGGIINLLQDTQWRELACLGRLISTLRTDNWRCFGSHANNKILGCTSEGTTLLRRVTRSSSLLVFTLCLSSTLIVRVENTSPSVLRGRRREGGEPPHPLAPQSPLGRGVNPPPPPLNSRA